VANNIKTVLLLGLLSGIILALGSLGGQRGLTIALFMAVAMNFVGYFFSDKIALRMHHAQPVTREEAPRLYSMVEFLASRAEIPVPKIYLIPEESPNAFATGRNPQNASVAVTQGALRLLSEDELRGVLAHELAHVKNRDILISSVAATMASMIMWVAQMARFSAFFGGGRDREDEGGGAIAMLVTILVAPIAAMLIQMWISRTREYEADASGAAIAASPQGLASALQKLENYSKRIPMEASPSTAHMFIMHPFTGGSLMNLFSTHPPTQKRIERLLGRAA
jgi:heat shock protein HtpX